MTLDKVITQWLEVIGEKAVVTTPEVVKIADDESPELRAVLMAVASTTKNDAIMPDRLGWWLRKNSGRSVRLKSGSFRIVRHDRTSRLKWSLERL